MQEHQTVVYQMIQQIQQKRELQRLQMAGGSQLPMASLLAGSSTPLLSAGTPGLLPAASAPALLPAGALVAPSLGNNPSLMAAAAAAAAVAAAGGPPVLTAQTNPFLSLAGADGSGPKGGVSRGPPGRPGRPHLLRDGQRWSMRRRTEATPRSARRPAPGPRAFAGSATGGLQARAYSKRTS